MYCFGKLIQCLFIITVFFGRRVKANGFGINLIKIADDDLGEVICTMAFLRKYFNSGENLSGSVLYMTFTSASLYKQNKLLEAMHTMEDFPWSIVIGDLRTGGSSKSSNAVLYEKPQCYFIIIENLEDEDLDDFFEEWKVTINWNPLAQFVVYLIANEGTEEEMTEIMIEILFNFMNKKIYNVNVIGRSEENTVYYCKTIFPYHPDNNCGNRVISLETVDICDYQMSERKNDNDNEGSGDAEENDYDGDNDDDNNDNENDNNNDNDESEKDDDDNSNDGDGDAGGDRAEDDGNNDNERDEENNDNDKNDGNPMIEDEEGNEEKNIEVDDDQAQENVQEKTQNNDNNKGLEEDQSENGSENKNKATDEKDKSSSENEAQRNESEGTDGSLSEYNEGEKTNLIENNEKYKAQNKLRIKRLNNPRINKRKKLFNYLNKNRERPFLQHSYPESMRLETNLNVKEKETTSPLKNQSEKPVFFFEEIFRALFLDKFPKDLSGCPLTAAFRPWEPFIFTETTEDTNKDNTKKNSPSNTEYDDYVGTKTSEDEVVQNYYDAEQTSGELDQEVQLAGIEYKLLQTIGELLHINIDLRNVNTNLYKLFQQLIDGDVEMLIGGIDEDPSISQHVSASVPYHQDDLTWCVAKARRSHNLFNFLASFSLTVWLVTLLYVVIAALTIRYMRHRLRIQLKFLNEFGSVMFRVFGILINQPIPSTVQNTSMRLVFASTFFMALIFINSYQSFLFSTLTTPKSAYQINRVEEIYQNRMLIRGRMENIRHLNKDGEIFRYIREQFQICYNIEECLKEAADNENIAVAVSRQHLFYNPRIPRSRLYCFDRNENLYVYLITMLLPKKYHLLHKINPIIQYVIESGHMEKWARDLDMRRRIREERNSSHEEKIRSLTLGQLAGTFLFGGVALAIGLFVFILEYYVYRHATQKRRRRLKIAKFLHRQFLRA